MSVERFEALVEWVGATYDVVPLQDLVTRAYSQRSSTSLRGLAALTFDDAYRGYLEHGVPVLTRLALPATVFVVSAAATDQETFWWDHLAALALLTDDDRRRHLDENRGASARILRELDSIEDPRCPALPSSMLPSSWDELQDTLRNNDLITVGSHTVSHPNLTRMGDGELAHELTGSRDEIEAHLGVTPDVVSYPYGLHDARVRAAARSAGYGAGLTLETGQAAAGGDPWHVPRLNVPARIGVEALECWAAGIHPLRGS